jgi:hypothetical protein
VQGQVAAGVTGLSVTLSDGSIVQATVADGSFVAWWPGSATATSGELTSAKGLTVSCDPRNAEKLGGFAMGDPGLEPGRWADFDGEQLTISAARTKTSRARGSERVARLRVRQ